MFTFPFKVGKGTLPFQKKMCVCSLVESCQTFKNLLSRIYLPYSVILGRKQR